MRDLIVDLSICGARITCPWEAPEFILDFSGVRIASSLVCCVVFTGHCFSFCVICHLNIILSVCLVFALQLLIYNFSMFKLYYKDLLEVFHLAHICSSCQVCNILLFAYRWSNIMYCSYLATNISVVGNGFFVYMYFDFEGAKAVSSFYVLSEKVCSKSGPNKS